MSASKKTIVLVGGGHAHAQVIKAYNWAALPPSVQVVLVDPLRRASYSGMVPGCVAGQYTPEDTQIDLETLARWAGTRFLHASVVGIDAAARELRLGPSPYTSSGGADIPETLHYDVVSFDIGCRTAHTDVPGVQEFAIATRPIHLLTQRISEKIATFEGDAVKLVVCAAGAAGIELAMTAAARIRKAGKQAVVTLVSTTEALLPGDPQPVQEAMSGLVESRGIRVVPKAHVVRVTASEVLLDSGDVIPHDLVIWPAGAASHPVAARLGEAGVAITKKGWIRVGSSLQSISHGDIFAAGDCCEFEHLSRQPGKAGVYAVRTGPILIKNLLGHLQGAAPEEYHPQEEFLRLFNCGDGHGLGIRFGVPMVGPWVWQWKDFIDRWFMDLFKEENLPDLRAGKADEGQFDAALRSSVSSAPESAAEAAAVLLSESAQLPAAKDIINRMDRDEAYRTAVQRAVAERWAARPRAPTAVGDKPPPGRQLSGASTSCESKASGV